MCICSVSRKTGLVEALLRISKMNKILIIFIVVLLFTVGGIRLAFADKILAIVGDEIITESELDKITHLWEYELKSELSDGKAAQYWRSIRKKALQRLIEDKLLYLEAVSEGIKVAPEYVEEQINRIKERFPTEQAFLESLKKMHITPQEFYDQIEHQLMVRKLIARKIRSKIYINPVEVARVFQESKDKFCKIEKVKLSSVFVPRSRFNKLSEMEFDSLVMDEYIKLTSGELTWRDLENEFEVGQISGWKKPADLAPKIAKQVFSENIGAYPLPVKVSTGYYFFRIEKREKNCPKTLTEAKEKVYNYLFQQKFDKKLDEYIKQLRSKFYVKINGEV